MTVAAGVDRPQLTTVAFFERLRDELNANEDFRRATEWVDMAVLFKLGDDLAVWTKWYRGQIIDLHEGPSPLGFTFALDAPTDVWRKIIDLPASSYRPWASLWNYGEIAVDGNAFEFTRVLEAIYIVCSHIRSIGTGEEPV